MQTPHIRDPDHFIICLPMFDDPPFQTAEPTHGKQYNEELPRSVINLMPATFIMIALRTSFCNNQFRWGISSVRKTKVLYSENVLYFLH